MTIILILSATIALLTAVALALRLIDLPAWRFTAVAFAAALVLMAIRQLVKLTGASLLPQHTCE